MLNEPLGGILETKLNYPLYHMRVNGHDEWLSLGPAARAFDNGFVQVDFGLFVIDAVDTIPRNITNEDQAKISDAADEFSASK